MGVKESVKIFIRVWSGELEKDGELQLTCIYCA
jgi:hypothetical protein